MSVYRELLENIVAKAVAGILAPVLAGLAFLLIRRAYRAYRALRYAEAALEAVARTQENGRWAEGPGFWLKQPIQRPRNYGDLQGNSIPILMIAATKGGVGKTSLAGSLAAHFALKWTQRRQEPSAEKPLRVLVIDQDFQGSFTTMTVDIDRRYRQPSKSNRLVSGALCNGGVEREAEPISQPGMRAPLSIWTISAYYDLAQAENRVLIEWLLPLSERSLFWRLLRWLGVQKGKPVRSTKDVRYFLAESLLDPHVQQNFDLIIIDAPPRLTTSHIQAMCASTHLLIPTILDGLSSDAVARYLDQVATHKLGLVGDSRTAICPYLRPIGVVCTLLPNNHADLTGRLNVLHARIAAGRLVPNIFPERCFIRQRPPYREHAGERIAYASLSNDHHHMDLRTEVDMLGDEIAPALGCGVWGWQRREA